MEGGWGKKRKEKEVQISENSHVRTPRANLPLPAEVSSGVDTWGFLMMHLETLFLFDGQGEYWRCKLHLAAVPQPPQLLGSLAVPLLTLAPHPRTCLQGSWPQTVKPTKSAGDCESDSLGDIAIILLNSKKTEWRSDHYNELKRKTKTFS